MKIELKTYGNIDARTEVFIDGKETSFIIYRDGKRFELRIKTNRDGYVSGIFIEMFDSMEAAVKKVKKLLGVKED